MWDRAKPGLIAVNRRGERFVNDYCILAENKEHARAVVSDELVRLLTSWPEHSLTRPVILMLMRGKLYLRMQFDDDSFTLEHALNTFDYACERILAQKAVLAHEG